jgi:lactoylglutathione lyase
MNSLEWIILKTNNYLDSKYFYGKILKLPVIRDVPDEEFCQFKLENCYLAIYGQKYFDQLIGSSQTSSPGSAIYAFAEVIDVDKVISDLKANGVKIIRDPQTQPWGQRVAYFTDPDGHIWEIQKWLK